MNLPAAVAVPAEVVRVAAAPVAADRAEVVRAAAEVVAEEDAAAVVVVVAADSVDSIRRSRMERSSIRAAMGR